jgi:hypothetical protein
MSLAPGHTQEPYRLQEIARLPADNLSLQGNAARAQARSGN